MKDERYKPEGYVELTHFTGPEMRKSILVRLKSIHRVQEIGDMTEIFVDYMVAPILVCEGYYEVLNRMYGADQVVCHWGPVPSVARS